MIFEQLVIMRFQRYEFETSTTLPGLRIPSCTDVELQTLPGRDTPPLVDLEKKKNRIWVPLLRNYIAVDVFLELKEQIWGVQIHTSNHKDVSSNFTELCKSAGWFESHNGTVHLLYLSPTPRIKNQAMTMLERKMMDLDATRGRNFTVSFASLEDFDCLKGMQWVDNA